MKTLVTVIKNFILYSGMIALLLSVGVGILTIRKARRNRRRRLKLLYVPFSEAQSYLDAGWTIAPEGDRNKEIGWVFLEKLEEL